MVAKITTLLIVTALSIVCCKNNITDLSPGKHDEYYKKGTSLIIPYMQLQGEQTKTPDKAELTKGIKYLDAVTSINSQNWAAFWIKGKAYQAMGKSKSAYNEFNKSFELQKKNADVARELMKECLNLGRGKEGVEISMHALKLEPKNPGLLANVGLAYLINSQLDEAEGMARKALIMDPNDGISKDLLKVILEIKDGKRKQPKKLTDLY